MDVNVKKLVLLEGCYEDVVMSGSEHVIFCNMLKVKGNGFEIYINPDMIVSLELLRGSDTIKRRLKIIERYYELSEVIEMQSVERTTMTAQEVATYLGCNRDTVYRLSNYGDLPYARIGRKKIFKKEAIDAWIDNQTQKARAGSAT